MNNKKNEDMLKTSKPKIEIDKQHKEYLRRELLNSPIFEKKRNWLSKNKMIFALSLSIAIILIILNPGFEEKPISAAELVDKVKTNYAGFNIADQLSVINSDLKIYGLENATIDLDVERFINFSSSQQRLTLLMKSNEEVLDDYIIKGSKLYRTTNPKIEFQINLPDEKMEKIVNSFNYSYSVNDSSTVNNVIVKKFESHESVIVYKTESENTELNKVQEYKFRVDDEVNIEKYLRDNPVKIAEEISADKVNSITVSQDKKLVVIDIEKDLEPKEYKLMMRSFHLSDDQHHDSINFTTFEFNHMNIDSLVKAEIKSNNVKKIQSVTINSESGDIIQVEYTINRNGNKRKLSKQSFYKIEVNDNNEDLFDEVKVGFTYSYEIK